MVCQKKLCKIPTGFIIHLLDSRQQFLFYLLQQLLCEAEALAKESIRLLLYEPPTNPEGMLARQAMYELKELRTIKARIEKTIKKSQSK